MIVHLRPESDFSEWRQKARALIAANLSPDQVFWEEGGASLFAEESLSAEKNTATEIKVSPAFLDLARSVACCSDTRRWALLYRLLWRITRGGEKNLLAISIDSDVALARDFTKKVRREIHKMHAFVRFRKLGEDEWGREKYAAWFEPDHWIVKAATPFFRDRFAQMDWSIFTPKGCAHWIDGKLGCTSGIDRDPCDHPDLLEEAWKMYYRSIFNPARLKVKMMRSEMPERYWKNMPEAQLIPELIRESRQRVETMFEVPERGIRELRGNSYIESLHQRDRISDRHSILENTTLEEIGTMVKSCRSCPLWERATCGVAGTGPADARIMIVGEQPGDQEDLVGKPFVGPSGELLDRALTDAGIDRAKAYLTNAVKHFKWKSHARRRLHVNPVKSEIEQCRPWLLAELEKVKPEILILLGSTAAYSMLEEGVKVSTHRGVIPDSALAPKVILSVHPAFILRQPDKRLQNNEYQRFVADLRLVH